MTKAQRKIIIVTAIASLILLIFCFFIYAPGKKQMIKLKQELAARQKEIDDIQAIVSQGDSLEQSITRLKERSRILEGKFPPKEEEVLGMISDFARKLNVNLVSISPSPKKIVMDENQKNIVIDNKVCQGLSVIIDFECPYRNLVKYTEALKQDLPALAMVENLEVNKNSSGNSRDLTVRLGLTFYILS